jgi:hypothetical protein
MDSEDHPRESTIDESTKDDDKKAGELDASRQSTDDSVRGRGATLEWSESLNELALIVTDYFQILAVVGSLTISPFPEDSSTAFVSRISNLALLNPSQSSAFRCVTGLGIVPSALLSMLFPFGLSAVVFSLQLLVDRFKNGKLDYSTHLKNAFPTLVLFLELVHTSVTSTSIVSLRDYQYEISSSKRMLISLDIEAGDSEYVVLRTVAAVVLVVYVFGFPIFSSAYLWRQFHRASSPEEVNSSEKRR